MEADLQELHDVLQTHSEKIHRWMASLKQMMSRFHSLQKNKESQQSEWKWKEPRTWFPSKKTTQIPKQIEDTQTEISLGPVSIDTYNDCSYQSTYTLAIGDIKKEIEMLENNIGLLWKSMEDNYPRTPENSEKQPNASRPIEAPVVQFYDREGYTSTAEFVTSLAKRLRHESFNPIMTETILELDRNKPVIIVCQARSRLQPDIDYALEGFQNLDDFHVAIVVIHMKEEHALPKMSCQYKVGGQERFKKICLIDAAFTREMKLYDCQMNSNATSKLANFITSYKKQ